MHDPMKSIENDENDESDKSVCLKLASCLEPVRDSITNNDIPTERTTTPPRELIRRTVNVRAVAKHLSRLRLNWAPPNWPRKFLLVVKEHVESACPIPSELINWLAFDSPSGSSTVVYVPISVKESLQEINGTCPRIKFWSANECFDKEDVDLVVSLGGDGTLLNAAWMFQGIVPPIIPFHAGTVGFLNVFDCKGWRDTLEEIITNGCRVTVRMRLECKLFRANKSAAEATFHVLNEMVIDRGAGPYMSMVDLLVDSNLITTVQADGLIVATPTGSTAYSMSAGGSVAHPEVPAILITPICPHSLSMRPLILPDSVDLMLRINENSRGIAWASFDGRSRIKLGSGDRLIVGSSEFPVPTVCKANQNTDWFGGLAHCLHWNDKPTSQHLL